MFVCRRRQTRSPRKARRKRVATVQHPVKTRSNVLSRPCTVIERLPTADCLQTHSACSADERWTRAGCGRGGVRRAAGGLCKSRSSVPRGLYPRLLGVQAVRTRWRRSMMRVICRVVRTPMLTVMLMVVWSGSAAICRCDGGTGGRGGCHTPPGASFVCWDNATGRCAPWCLLGCAFPDLCRCATPASGYGSIMVPDHTSYQANPQGSPGSMSG